MDRHDPDVIEQKLARALKAKAVLAERSKQLAQQIEDFRNRDQVMAHTTSELLERQRELNFMLHKASSVLHQLQDTNLALSTEFTHIVKELPAAQESGWEDTVSRVNELFQRTHQLAGDLQEEIFEKTADSEMRIDFSAASKAAPEPEAQAQEAQIQEAEQPPEIEEVEEEADAFKRRDEVLDRLFGPVDESESPEDNNESRQGFWSKLLGRTAD